MIGTSLLHYEILAEISRGGMGVVYRARDTGLNREVALKVLPPALLADPDRKRRFVQEAQSAARLTHPHIATIYEIGESAGVSFIAMELIDGRKLADMLDGKPLPVHRALELATEIAEGLARAHAGNVVHRDIKPANIMVTTDGHVKIIDFGLAKLVPAVSGDSDGLTTADHTSPGTLLGTMAYMSPEQARGITLDHRTDIFSLGVVLFEMIDGRRPFRAETTIDTLHAILNAPAPSLPSSPSRSALVLEVQRVVHRCLEKNPDDRYQTARDLSSELRRLSRQGDSGETVTSISPIRSRTRLMTIAAGTMLVAAAIALWIVSAGRWRNGPVTRLTNPLQLTSAQGAESSPTWSPDGSRVAYVRDQDIWVSQLGGSAVRLTGDPLAEETFPSWSPDGSQIAFASRGRDGSLAYFVVPAVGGQPRRILPVSGNMPGRPAWSPDGRRLAVSTWDTSGILRLELVTLASMESQMLAAPGRENMRGDLSWSPDTRFIAYVDYSSPSPDVTQLWLATVSDNQTIALSDGRSLVRTPSFSPDGRTLYYVSNQGGSSDLWSQNLRSDGRPAGDPQRLTTGVGMSSAALSDDGAKIAYTRGRETLANVWRIPLLRDRTATWADAEQLTSDEAFVEFIDVTPNGLELVLSSDRRGNQDIWRMPSAGGEMQPVTSDPTPDWRPSVSADGKQIVFYAYRTGNRELWTMPLAGGPARQVTFHEAGDYHPVWSPDGSRIAFSSTRTGNFNVWVVGANGGEPRVVASNPGDNMPAWSPDGRWIAFRRLMPDGGRLYRVPVAGGEPEQVTRETVQGFSRWSRDGQSLYYPRQGTQFWQVTIDTGIERLLADFSGKSGTVGPFSLAADTTWLYYTWQTAESDLWTMDVVR